MHASYSHIPLARIRKVLAIAVLLLIFPMSVTASNPATPPTPDGNLDPSATLVTPSQANNPDAWADRTGENEQAASPTWAGEDPSAAPAYPGPAVNSPVGSMADGRDRASAQSPDSPSATVISHYRVAGTALRPLSSATTYSYDIAGCQKGAIGPFHAPVQLPQNSVIRYLRVYYHNTVAGSHQGGTGYLLGYDGVGGTKILLTVSARSASTIGSIGYNSDLSVYSGQIVDNYNNAYLLLWSSPGTDQAICGFRLQYDRPLDTATFLPTVLRN